MENVFRNQLISKNQSLRGNALVNSLPRNGPHVTIHFELVLSPDNSVNIATRPDDRRILCTIPGGEGGDFSLRFLVQTLQGPTQHPSVWGVSLTVYLHVAPKITQEILQLCLHKEVRAHSTL
jgi:hypothetical protein